MVKRIGSSRRKTKHMMTKHRSASGKFPIRSLVQGFAIGEKVVLKAEPSVHKGLYFRRFHAKTAEVFAKRGRCYEVVLMDGGKEKRLIVSPAHMVKV